MSQLIFSTGNREKYKAAADVCRSYGIELIQKSLEIIEIQSEDPAEIVTDKVVKAYSVLKQPVVVSDDSWYFEALNGFPGPYMKSINHWFSDQDFINLTGKLKNKRVHLVMYLAFKDADHIKLFSHKHSGFLLSKPKGKSGPAAARITTLGGDNGLSISEIYDQGKNNSTRDASKVWHSFVEYYQKAQKP